MIPADLDDMVNVPRGTRNEYLTKSEMVFRNLEVDGYHATRQKTKIHRRKRYGLDTTYQWTEYDLK